MGNAAKKIIDGLKKAKVSAADQGRSKHLIDEAHDWDAKQTAEVESVVRYVCGVGELPATLSKDVLEHRCDSLLRGLSKGRKLDGWDTRALDVIARCKKFYWFWELDSWLRDRVVKHAAEPIFDEALELFRARGLWPDDQSIITSMVDHLTGHVTDKGELTSTGRWLIAQLDRDAAAVFKVARAQKEDESSSLYRLLLAHRRDLFDKLVPQLALKKDSDKSFLAEVMLEADAARYEQQAVDLMAGLTGAIPAVLSARNLEKFFPGKYRDDVKRLLLATIRQKGTSFIVDKGVGDTRAIAYTMAWKVLGDEAFEIWNAYTEENDALRLDFYATIAKQAKAKALPLLIDGLVYPKDPNVEYGFINHAKYVSRMLEILKPYDLAPYRDRIEQAFASNKNKKIRELLAPILGKGKGKPAAPNTKATKPATKAKPFPCKSGYRFEAYTEAVTKAAIAAIKRAKTLPSPIEQVKLAGFQGEVQLNHLLIEGVGDSVELELSVPRTKVPGHVDYSDEDNVLPSFVKLHGLTDEEEIPSWGDMFKLPWCVLLHEQIGAAHAIVDALRKQGHKIAKGCKVGVGEDDNFWESTKSFERMSRSEIAALPKAQQADFAAVCFEDPEKQRWLLKR